MKGAVGVAEWYVCEASRLKQAGRTDPKLLWASKLLEWLQGQPGGMAGISAILTHSPNALRTKVRSNHEFGRRGKGLRPPQSRGGGNGTRDLPALAGASRGPWRSPPRNRPCPLSKAIIAPPGEWTTWRLSGTSSPRRKSVVSAARPRSTPGSAPQ